MTSRMYIAILDDFPDYMTPTLVAHSMLNAHIKFQDDPVYKEWLENDFRKCTVRVSKKEFSKISNLDKVHLGHENRTMNAEKACAIVCPYPSDDDIPNVLKYAKLWSPKV